MKNAAAVLLIIVTLTGCSVVPLHKKSGDTSAPASVPSVQEQESAGSQKSADDPSNKTAEKIWFVGAIGNAKIHAQFDITGTTATGVYYYDKYQKNIKIKGSMVCNEFDNLEDYQFVTFIEDTEEKGEIKGIFKTNDYLEGFWKSDKKIYPMYLIREGADINPPILPGKETLLFDGHWTGKNSSYYEGSDAEIKVLFDDLIYYDLTAVNGFNIGGLSSFAIIRNKSAKTVFSEKNVEDENIVYEFQVKDNKLYLQSNMYGFCCGNGVSFDSCFIKGNLEIPMPSALEIGIVETAQQEEVFKELVGDFYKVFISYSAEVDYLEAVMDGETVKAGSSFLRGAPATCFYIISSNYIYVAIRLGDGIDFFTNDIRYEDKLPEPMVEWAGESKVIYRLKK